MIMDHLYEVNPGRTLILPEKFGDIKDRIWAITGDYVTLENPLLRQWMQGQMGKLTKRRILPKGKTAKVPAQPAALRAMAAAVGDKLESPKVQAAKAIIEEEVDLDTPPNIVPPDEVDE